MSAVVLALALACCQDGYTVRKEHPRIFIDDPKAVASRVDGVLAADYKIVKDRADAAARRGASELGTNGWGSPIAMMDCALAACVEKAAGREGKKYVDVIVALWGDGTMISKRAGSQFGFHALAYDWVYDQLTPDQRVRYGEALGSWLTWYTDKPVIQLKNGHWEYNQTWGPSHLNIPHSRDALTQKLFISLTILGAGTKYEADAKAFLDSWHQRVPKECIPAFDRMGGVWSESYGHGGYGPVVVVAWAFHAWRTATGIDLFKQLKPWGYPVEEPRWVAYTMMPHNERTAWIDDGDGARPGEFCRAAPMLRDGLSQWFVARGRAGLLQSRWELVSSMDPAIAATGPETLPLGYLFGGAGHVYMRSAWNDPNATWAFFGAGPQFAGHSRDDEGHFLVARKGAVVSRQGGQGSNDEDYYSGGSIIYNLTTIFDPEEKFRRDRKNENDGGLLRHVYEDGPYPRERGHTVAFEQAKAYTYAAADLTRGYSAKKAKEVTRQILYLRGPKEYFVIFDRVEATQADFARHFFLHVPTEPEKKGGGLSWLSLPEADGDKSVLSTGRSRAFLRTLLPAQAGVNVRGDGAWGHPLEPAGQYDHVAPGRRQPPLCAWRIEVADPGKGARTLFLHVLELADDSVAVPTDLRLVGAAGVDIGERWKIRFNAEGALGGSVGDSPLTTSIRTESQYR
ncbi:MAG TPA: hypothetical protein VE981_07550 [Planctomycetota bacterium]|nr:hypothetical protein [Planctomycetota bacterium]